MSFQGEREKRFRVLAGRNIVVIESANNAVIWRDLLEVDQGMNVTFVDEPNFPLRLDEYMLTNHIDSSIIHVSGVATKGGADSYKINVIEAYQHHPRMIILEGDPIFQETIDMYDDLRKFGIPMISKFYPDRVVGRLAQLFTQIES